MDLDPTLLDRVLQALGAVLEARRLRFELVVVGGSSLMLLGLIDRPTRDLDVLAVVDEGKYRRPEPLPEDLVEARDDVGETFGLGREWLNPGPADLLEFGLPSGFEERVETKTYGGLVLHIAGRFDQVCLKLYAAVDQGPRSKHADDLTKLSPTTEELLAAAGWARSHDPSEGFRQVLVETLRQMGVEVYDADL